jgi:hypothetical protein
VDIPKVMTIRLGLAHVFVQLVKRAQSSNACESENAFKLIALLSRWLFTVQHDNPDHRTNGYLITARLSLLLDEDYQALDTFARREQAAAKVFNYGHSTERLHRSVAAHLRDGQISKAAAQLTEGSAVLDPNDANVKSQVRHLFVQESTATQVQEIPLDDAFVPLTVDQVTTALATSSKRTGAGCSGWRMSHLNVIRAHPLGAQAITNLVNLFLDVKNLPMPMHKFLRTGLLTALSKPDSDPKNPKIRPITVLDCFLRLASKAVLCAEQAQVTSSFAPLQFGVGAKGGTQTATHLLRGIRYLQPQWCSVLVDCKNAYGTLKRSAIRKALCDLPENHGRRLKQFFNAYGRHPFDIISRGEAKAQAADGVLQGSPESPLLFALGLHPVLKALQQFFDGKGAGFVMAYLDDITLVCPPAFVKEAMQSLTTQLASIGLEINRAKCQLLRFGDCNVNQAKQLAMDLGFQAVDAVKFLGTPVGSAELEQKMAVSLIKEQTYQSLQQYPDLQGRFALLKHAIILNTNFIARTLPPSSSKQALEKADGLVQEVLASILQCDPKTLRNSDIPREAGLPIRNGGAGVTCLAEHRHVSYFASAAEAIHLLAAFPDRFGPLANAWTNKGSKWFLSLELQVSLAMLLSKLPQETPISAWLPQHIWDLPKFTRTQKLQSEIMTWIHNRAAQEISSAIVDKEQRIRWNAKTGVRSMASAFLLALPSSPMFVLSNTEFTIALRSHLRMGVLDFVGVPRGTLCPCNATKAYHVNPVTCTEAHVLGCGYAYASSIRHEHLKHVIARMARTAGFTVELEPRLGLAALANAKNRGDLSFTGLRSDGKKTMIDVSLRNALTEKNLNASRVDYLKTVQDGFKDKINHSPHLVSSNDTEFLPAIVDSLGVIHPRLVGLVHAISHFTNHQPPEDSSYVTSNFSAYFIQAISVTIRRAVARHVIELARVIRQRLHAGSREASDARSLGAALPSTNQVDGLVSE